MKDEQLKNLFQRVRPTIDSERTPSASPQWLSEVMSDVCHLAERENETEVWSLGMWRVSFASLLLALALFPFAQEYDSTEESKLLTTSSTAIVESDLDPFGYQNVFGVSL